MKYPLEKDEKHIRISFIIFQTNENFNGQLVHSPFIVKQSTLKYGRGININDIKEHRKVIVIDSITNDLFFKGNGLGQNIKFPIYENIQNDDGTWQAQISSYEFFEIVGVYTNDQTNYQKFNKDLNSTKGDEEMIYQSECYIPMSCACLW